MKPWQIGLVVLLVLFGYAVMMAPETTAPTYTPSPTPTTVSKEEPYGKQEYMKECNTEPGFTEYCECTYNYVISHMSVSEIEAAADASEEEINAIVQPAYEACAHKLF